MHNFFHSLLTWVFEGVLTLCPIPGCQLQHIKTKMGNLIVRLLALQLRSGISIGVIWWSSPISLNWWHLSLLIDICIRLLSYVKHMPYSFIHMGFPAMYIWTSPVLVMEYTHTTFSNIFTMDYGVPFGDGGDLWFYPYHIPMIVWSVDHIRLGRMYRYVWLSSRYFCTLLVRALRIRQFFMGTNKCIW